MFWKYNSTSSSQIEAVLAKEDVTLQELMDEDDIINECKLQNKTLIDFLVKPEVIEELVTLITIEPCEELDERTRFKYPNIACEILTCDVSALNERLASDEALLSKLYVFLDSEPPLNPLLASFFSKIMGVLIAKKTEQVLDFLKAKDNFISLLLKHLGTSAIMDLTLKLMTQVEGVEVRQNILNWLDSQRIIQSLVSLLNPTVDKERHYNVAQLLCDFIRISRDTQRNCTERNDPDPLLNTLESLETVSLLLDNMLKETKTESCIVGGIQILLTILDVNRNSCEESADLEQKQIVILDTTLAIIKRLKDFHNILLDPPKKPSIDTTVGLLEIPLGNTRLQITKLLAAFIQTNNADLMKELISLGTFQVLLDLFFKFSWNNFLHTQVEACITSALKTPIPSEIGDNNALYQHLLVNCKLVERILDTWKENDAQQQETKGVRQGYMGHLTNIANNVAQLCSTSSLGEYMKENLPAIAESFNTFTETTLQDTNLTREILLGGAHPNVANEDNDEYGDVPFPQSNLLHQQIYAQYQYQMQNFTPQFIESYGFNDDDFNDGDDTLQTIDHRTGMNFDLSEGDLVQQHELFKQVCAQNINTLDDVDDQIFEDRDHTFQTVIEKQEGEGHNFGAYSSDSEEDDSSPTAEDPFIDVDPWTSNKDDKSSTDGNPWNAEEKSKPKKTDTTGWADFSSPSFANFEANFENVPEPVDNEPSKISAAASVIEKDIMVETVNADSKVDGSKNEDNMDSKNMGDSKNVIEDDSADKSKDSNSIGNESIDNIAQIVKKAVDEIKIEDAMEELKIEGTVDQGQDSSGQKTEVESVNPITVTEQEIAPLQTGSTDTIDKPESDKKGI